MKIIRFVLPFLFVRNWYDGSWELSPARLILTTAGVLLVLAALTIAYVLQTPVFYTSTL